MAKALSVIVCTFDRYDILQTALRTLLDQGGLDPAAHEILVVDNTPPHLRQPISLGPAADDRIRVECCENVGLSHARNHGIAHSSGDIIVFLDDDAYVAPGWADAILRAFNGNATAEVVGGKVVPRYESEELPPWYDDSLASYLSCIDWGPEARFLRPGEWVVGANMAFRRRVFEAYGMFDTSLGRRGAASLLSNEETELFGQIGMSRIFYEPRMLVEHLVPVSRLTPDWFRKRVYWQAVSNIVAGHLDRPYEELAQEYGRVIASLEAEHRNLRAFSFEPRSYDEFSKQLRAIYLAAAMLGNGMRTAA